MKCLVSPALPRQVKGKDVAKWLYLSLGAYEATCSCVEPKNNFLANGRGNSLEQPFWVTIKVIIYKSHGEPFLWNRIWDLGWFWAGWQFWKFRTGPYSMLLLRTFFYFFLGKKYLYVFSKYCSIRTKKLHNINVRKPYFFVLKYKYKF